MRSIIIFLTLLLASCATPQISQETSPGGKPYTLHLDPQPWPCLYRGWQAGCQRKDENGRQHIYLSGVYPQHTKRHEEGHVDGMWHSDWDEKGCAVVYAGDSTGRYKSGDTICMHDRREEIKKAR